MSKAHTDAGKESERLWAAYLRTSGWPSAERTVRTGYRVRGRELADVGDIDGTPGIVWQVKRLWDKREGRDSAAVAETKVPGWMAETEGQRHAAQASVGVLVVRRERWLPAHWWAFVPMADLLGLADGFSSVLTATDRSSAPLMPVRLAAGDLVTMLRGWGYGDTLAGEVAG